MEKKPINHYWFGSKFLEYCVKKEWLIQEGKVEGAQNGIQPKKVEKHLKKNLE